MTEVHDKLSIDGIDYSGWKPPNDPIDQIVPNSFDLYLLSILRESVVWRREGFTLLWQCYNESSSLLKGFWITPY